MSVLAIGMSHRSAPLTLLERAVVAAPDTPKLLDELLRCPSVDEVGLLSTCNRVEVYAVVESFHSAVGRSPACCPATPGWTAPS
jgi:glutamyl-tRNA reductase